MTPRFSIIHPSLGRPDQAVETARLWLSTAKHGYDIQYIVSLNSTDATRSQYLTKFSELPGVIIVTSEATNMVAASNVGAKEATGDILVLVSDDMHPLWHWDDQVAAEFDPDYATVLQVHDGIRNDIVTLPIMNRAAYKKLGYMYHPSYLSMYADNDLAETAKVHGMYKVSQLQFEHRHYSVGKAPVDATYKKENSKVSYEYGQRTFEWRKRNGFPL
jgi:glycosyltransferase involved in cell wall biosynthesis